MLMCARSGKVSKVHSAGSGTGYARLALFVLCFLSLASPLSAAADWFFLRDVPAESGQIQAVESVEQKRAQAIASMVEEPEASAVPSGTSATASMPYSPDSVQTLESRLAEFGSRLESSMVVSGNLKEDFQNLMSSLEQYADAEAIEDDVHQATLDALEAIETANVQQADDIARLDAELRKANATKAYARVGGVLGFDSMVPTWGLTGALGIRLGESFLMETGVTYMMGSFTRPLDLQWSLDNLQVSASIGWEW